MLVPWASLIWGEAEETMFINGMEEWCFLCSCNRERPHMCNPAESMIPPPHWILIHFKSKSKMVSILCSFHTSRRFTTFVLSSGHEFLAVRFGIPRETAPMIVLLCHSLAPKIYCAHLLFPASHFQVFV